MHRKRSFIRVLTRALYASGFIFLIVGLLLSALSTSVMAAGGPSLNLSQSQANASGTPCCKTVTPYGTPPKATRTGVAGSPSPTNPAVNVNLSPICGYPSDTYLLWRVANHTNSATDYSWKVVGSSEKGSGRISANGVDYFKTAPALKVPITVQLYVNGKLYDTESCLSACKTDMQLSYVCTANGLEWYASNVNTFGVDYNVTVDSQSAGKGVIPANGKVKIATTTTGAHSVKLTWKDTRPESHTVTLTSPANSCSPVITATSTFTPPPNIITITSTPTFTVAPPTVTHTATPTATFTPSTNIITETVTPTVTETLPPPPPVLTNTATATATETLPPPPPVLTNTATATATETLPPPPPVLTNTATATATETLLPPPVILTNTATATATVTATSTETLTPPPVVLTNTPTATATGTLVSPPIILTNTATATQTATASPTVTTTLTSQPGFIITPTTGATTAPPVETATPTETASPTETSTATQIVTLAPPAMTITSTPVLIPVTGVDLTRPIGANSLSLFGGLFTNIGLFTLGLALALTGINSQLKD